MANITTTAKGGTANSVAASNPLQLVTHEINIADVAATVTTGGYATIVNVPADTYYEFLQAEVVTTLDLDSSTSDRVDIGDETDDDQFVSNATTLTAGTNLTIATTVGSLGLVYTAGEAVRLKLTGDKLAGGTANATGIIRFVWLQGDTSRKAPAVATGE